MLLLMPCLVAWFYFFFYHLPAVESFATHFTSDYCGTSMKEGVVVMGKSIEYNLEKNLNIYDLAAPNIYLTNGSVISSFASYAVKLEPKSFQMVLEIHGGLKFIKGKCDGTRTNANNAVIDTSAVQSSGQAMTITIVAVWAKSYSGGVKLAAPITVQIQKNPTDSTSSVEPEL